MELELTKMYDRTVDVSPIKNKKLDILYGKHEKNLMDLYYPDEFQFDKKLPLILFVTGGAFERASKRHFQVAPALQGIKKGYAVASITYRVLPDDIYPSALWDVKSAVRYLKANADKLCIDADRIVAWGESAGAILVTMLGYTDGIAEFEDRENDDLSIDTKVKAIVNWYGAVDYLKIYYKNKGISNDDPQKGMTYTMEYMFGKKDEELVELLKKLQVERYFKEGMCPLLIEQGKQDQYVDWHGAVELYQNAKKYLSEEKGEIEFHLFDDYHHGVEDFFTEENMEIVYNFIERWI